MRQITPKNKKSKKVVTHHRNTKKKHVQYGTSKLEIDFAKEFLESNDIPYIYQYEAKDIKRFYDFAILKMDENYLVTENKYGLKTIEQNPSCRVSFFIEVDGDYW